MIRRVTVGSALSGITIGIRGENVATQVIFDCKQLTDRYGNGTAALLIKRPGDTQAYPALVTQDGDIITWDVTSTDTAREGLGKAELFWYVGELLAKSVVYTLLIAPDIGASGSTPPDPYEDWVEEITRIGTQASEDAQTASQAAHDAEAALGAMESMTVSASQLPSGSQPTANYEDGHLAFGIPLADAEIRLASISLSASWIGDGPWTQIVEVEGALVTGSSIISLYPTAAQLAVLVEAGVTAIVIDNNAGTLTATALGAPAPAMTVQCSVTEVS